MIVIGAGAGGLAASVDLARRGAAVTVLERAAAAGGKIRQRDGIDAGPTVLTMRSVLDALFADAGDALDRHLALRPADVLARHAWSQTERLDLFADPARSEDAIGRFAGSGEAAAYADFRRRAARIWQTLDALFMRAPLHTPVSLARGAGLRGLGGLLSIAPFTTLWRALGEHFHDPRLRQLFGRYATYSGSSPFLAPATLMLIAHVEQSGVWLVDGGMIRVAQAVAGLAEQCGARIRTEAEVAEIIVRAGRVAGVRMACGECLDADAVVLNGDPATLAAGTFGDAAARAVPGTGGERSLSALTWTVRAETAGFPLLRHNVFFSRDYKAEFDTILRDGQLPADPTVYVCAQDRGATETATPSGAGAGGERLLLLVNAPAVGDRRRFTPEEIARCTMRTLDVLRRCGLTVSPSPRADSITTPNDFAAMFPATGGALYGRAVHGTMAAFKRPGARTAIPGLYLAGGGVHPGPGVPMAMLSGRLAAAALLEDRISA